MVIVLVAHNLHHHNHTFHRTHSWTHSRITCKHLAHPVFLMSSGFLKFKFKNLLKFVAWLGLFAESGMIKEASEGWREQGGGLKGAREKRRRSPIQEIRDARGPSRWECYFMKHADKGSVEKVTLNSPFDHPKSFVSLRSLHILSFLCQCAKLGMISVCGLIPLCHSPSAGTGTLPISLQTIQ